MPQTQEPVKIDPTRLKKRADYVFVRHGTSERRRSCVVQARRKQADGAVGTGFTATKKIGGAVERNRAKRRLRHAAAELIPQYGVAGMDYVFIARRETPTISWQRLLDDMESALISLANQG
ncbi:MAG: ribonuclease P protein component [Pseudomonadota bacterium]